MGPLTHEQSTENVLGFKHIMRLLPLLHFHPSIPFCTQEMLVPGYLSGLIIPPFLLRTKPSFHLFLSSFLCFCQKADADGHRADYRLYTIQQALPGKQCPECHREVQGAPEERTRRRSGLSILPSDSHWSILSTSGLFLKRARKFSIAETLSPSSGGKECRHPCQEESEHSSLTRVHAG